MGNARAVRVQPLWRMRRALLHPAEALSQAIAAYCAGRGRGRRRRRRTRSATCRRSVSARSTPTTRWPTRTRTRSRAGAGRIGAGESRHRSSTACRPPCGTHLNVAACCRAAAGGRSTVGGAGWMRRRRTLRTVPKSRRSALRLHPEWHPPNRSRQQRSSQARRGPQQPAAAHLMPTTQSTRP